MRLTRVFYDIDMRQAFQGLSKIALDAKTKLDDTQVCFLNRAQTSLKILIKGKILVYYKNGKRIDLNVIEHLPEHFGGSKLEFEKAVRSALVKKLGSER